MKVLLILKRDHADGVKILVNAHNKILRQKVAALLTQDKGREAFDLLMKEAEVEACLSPGEDPPVKPAVTLDESLLR